MAECEVCEKEMKTADTCHEPVDADFIQGTERCHDCNVAPGGTHHPGCDSEYCGICRQQAIGCSCPDLPYFKARPTAARWSGRDQ